MFRVIPYDGSVTDGPVVGQEATDTVDKKSPVESVTTTIDISPSATQLGQQEASTGSIEDLLSPSGKSPEAGSGLPMEAGPESGGLLSRGLSIYHNLVRQQMQPKRHTDPASPPHTADPPLSATRDWVHRNGTLSRLTGHAYSSQEELGREERESGRQRRHSLEPPLLGQEAPHPGRDDHTLTRSLANSTAAGSPHSSTSTLHSQVGLTVL